MAFSENVKLKWEHEPRPINPLGEVVKNLRLVRLRRRLNNGVNLSMFTSNYRNTAGLVTLIAVGVGGGEECITFYPILFLLFTTHKGFYN